MILVAKIGTPTNEIEFTWDQGKTWETIKISQDPFMVHNIITEPKNTSQQFLVYGSAVREDADSEASHDSKGVLVYMDFEGLHEPQCQGVDYAGTEGSDFELWTPYDGRHGDNKCYLGQQVTYIRRK